NDMFYRSARHDQAGGTYQFGSRTYDPTKASFLTPDNSRSGPSSANLAVGTDPLTRDSYAYVNGDPVNLIDPSGHSAACNNKPGSDCFERAQGDLFPTVSPLRLAAIQDAQHAWFQAQ